MSHYTMSSSSDSDDEVPLSYLKHPVMMTEGGKLTVPDKDNKAVSLPKISNSLSNTHHDKEITLAVLQQQKRKADNTASVDSSLSEEESVDSLLSEEESVGSSSSEEESFTLLKDFNPERLHA